MRKLILFLLLGNSLLWGKDLVVFNGLRPVKVLKDYIASDPNKGIKDILVHKKLYFALQ